MVHPVQEVALGLLPETVQDLEDRYLERALVVEHPHKHIEDVRVDLRQFFQFQFLILELVLSQATRGLELLLELPQLLFQHLHSRDTPLLIHIVPCQYLTHICVLLQIKGEFRFISSFVTRLSLQEVLCRLSFLNGVQRLLGLLYWSTVYLPYVVYLMGQKHVFV